MKPLKNEMIPHRGHEPLSRISSGLRGMAARQFLIKKLAGEASPNQTLRLIHTKTLLNTDTIITISTCHTSVSFSMRLQGCDNILI
jgi:hypothetical protein